MSLETPSFSGVCLIREQYNLLKKTEKEIPKILRSDKDLSCLFEFGDYTSEDDCQIQRKNN